MYDIFANPQWTTPVMIVKKIHKIYRYKILTIQFLHCRMTFLSRLNCDFVLYNIMNYILHCITETEDKHEPQNHASCSKQYRPNRLQGKLGSV